MKYFYLKFELLFQAKLNFEISNEEKSYDKDGIVLYGLKLVGSVFDHLTTSILPSE